MAENEIKLNICYGCMRKLEEGQQTCPFCRYDLSQRQNPENALPEGTVLSRKYMIGKVLGRGGFGITYLGYDLDLQLTVAIKEYFPREVCRRSSQSYNVLPESDMEDGAVFSKGREVLLDEARTLAKFNSPYIVHVRDFFREHGTAYIVMDYVDGITLRAEMKKNGGKLPYERVLSLMEPLIRELDALHEENIIHRDIKPDNIMLVRDRNGERLVLLDFGSARTYVSNESRTMTGVVTAGYSPLEQYSQKSRQGPYTDVYALCATMYHAITGVLPPASIERNVDDTPLKSFEECGVNVPKAVERAIMHGMALKSTERTRTMGKLLEDLDNWSSTGNFKDEAKGQPTERTSEAKADEVAPTNLPKRQEKKSSTRAETVKQEKNGKRSSAGPKIFAALIAGVLLVEGIYFGFQMDTDKPGKNQKETKETVAASAEPVSAPTPTPTPTPTAHEADFSAFKTVGNIVTFGTYEQDNNTSNGKEEIEWIVLANEGNKSLLISRNALDCRPYNTSLTDVTWENSSLRPWLNSSFLNAAFSLNEQQLILKTSVDNSKSQGNSKWSTNGGNNTTDQIFLLSYAEAEKYFSSDSDRICKPTAYAKAQGAYAYDSRNCWWWLRSPGYDQDYTADVNTVGSLGGSLNVLNDSIAVRPAFWIDLESEIF